jgi:adenine-specific DNA methylase
MTRRLIEDWLPIAALGEESVRERRSMTALPPTYYLHVWWARRPLVASRAAVLASLLPSTASHDKFLQLMGIHGDPVGAKRKMDQARRTGVRVDDPYGYSRAFTYRPTEAELAWLACESKSICTLAPSVLDPTAGGGSVPFESARLGLSTFANDLNPVASLIERATIQLPILHGSAIKAEVERLGSLLRARLEKPLTAYFPQRGLPNDVDATYLWSRTIRCPHCEGVVPLSPNWRLAPDGTGVGLEPQEGHGPGDRTRHVRCVIVSTVKEQSQGTVSGGDATCPFDDCHRLIDGDFIKAEAQAGRMGEQLYAVVFKRRIQTQTKAGKRGKDKWERGYRAPRPEDDVSEQIAAVLAEKMPDWEALDMVPTELVPLDINDNRPIQYGMPRWRDLFSPRQLLGHCTAVEVFRQLIEEEKAAGHWSELTAAAFAYLSLSLDKMLNYNSRMSVWMSTREVMANTFNRHDFAFCWSHAEMAPLIVGLGYDWAIEQTAKCIGELVALVRPDAKASASGQTEMNYDGDQTA